jgi:phosphatidylglycerophosphate synthase
VVLTREVFISVVALVIAAAGATRIDVLWIGKASTFGLLVAFPLFLLR